MAQCFLSLADILARQLGADKAAEVMGFDGVETGHGCIFAYNLPDSNG